ncbi:nuclear transport factor 2 family protein [Flavobacterium sp. HJJ]|uniref:nuclear transport factor 2 family protein n=1 Tax=Flavobacterium sp. HJJ TaxID=2783792 RepID=UPI00188D92BF|nr:nuclear transport factor 2 family protein [Flavobacterium sp. HJJ]MBF4472310.1 nuclear transport factor 2 family protein [Flavobacterium sp. HJJ]
MRTLFILLLVSINFAFGQVSKDSELFLALQKHDSIFFERGFNRCDIDYLVRMTHKDLVFYHDRGGIQDKNKFLENTKKNLCSDSNKKPIRKVRKESLEVFPLYNNGVLYGAVQTGIHDFFIREPNKEDIYTGTAKITHVYLLENKEWILKEVLSFDHK